MSPKTTYVLALAMFISGGIYLIMQEHDVFGGFLLLCACFLEVSEGDSK